MTGEIQPPPGTPIPEELGTLRNVRGYLLAVGIVLIVLGALAIMVPFIPTLTITIALGILLGVAGVVQIATSLWAGRWGGFFLHLVLGILYLVAGCVMLKNPLAAAAGITVVLAVSYMVGGLMRIAFGVTHRIPGREWVLLNGIITLVLGIAIWWEWPGDSLWVIGLFVGVDMVFLGWSWVMLALALRSNRAQPV